MTPTERMERTIDLYRGFFEDERPGQIIPVVTPYTFPVPATDLGLDPKPLADWSFTDDLETFVDRSIDYLRRFVAYTEPLDDCYIPALFPFLGIGLTTAFISGVDMTLSGDASWAPPAVADWDDLDELSLDLGWRWMEVVTRMAELIARKCDGSFVPETFSHAAPSDMANALRGSAFFTDFYDSPEEAGRLLDFCADATVWLQRELRKVIPHETGGTAEGGMWIPGEAPFLSEDASDLCSAEIFREFLAPRTASIIERLGGAFIHHHAKGFHIHDRLAGIPGLKVLQIAQDPDCETPLTRAADLIRQNGTIPLVIECDAADVPRYLDRLTGGRIVLQLRITSIEQGRETVGMIKRASSR